jgi:hypothetical protein
MRLLAYVVTLMALACANEIALAANPDNGRLSRSAGAEAATLSRVIRLRGPTSPSFVSIAERPDFNAETVASFLLEPHLKMPKHGVNPTSHSVVFPQR